MAPGDGHDRAGRPELGDKPGGVSGRGEDDDGGGLGAIGGLDGRNGHGVGDVLVVELGLETFLKHF